MLPPHNKVVRGGNAIDYAHREVSNGTVPLVLLQHFRGNLENWDPAFVDELGAQRRVVAFDNVGVAATTGVTPDTIDQMARDALRTALAGLIRKDATCSSGRPSGAGSARAARMTA
jgi:pimeloyl-ACP methyl ester carboxylesterase